MQISPIHPAPPHDPSTDPIRSAPAGEFRLALESVLGESPSGMVSEEELFFALITDRMDAHPEARDFVVERQFYHLASGESHEAAAVLALQDAMEAGLIDRETADEIYSVAFQAAQFDDNSDALYDDRGSTRAVASATEAMQAATEILRRIQSGTLERQVRSLAAPDAAASNSPSASVPFSSPSSSTSDGGFLWKPVSESDGNLVILLPPSLRGQVDRVELHRDLPPRAATQITSGRFSGDTHNGGRPHFRFDQPGRAYGSDVHVVAYGPDGDIQTWRIPQGAARFG